MHSMVQGTEHSLRWGSCKPFFLAWGWYSAKASTAAAALRARVAELARKADLAQTLLGNLVPVSMRDLATTHKVEDTCHPFCPSFGTAGTMSTAAFLAHS